MFGAYAFLYRSPGLALSTPVCPAFCTVSAVAQSDRSRTQSPIGSLLLNADVAADECAACGITVAQTDRNGVRGSGKAVISHTHAERDSCPIVQTSVAAHFGGIGRYGETLNFSSNSSLSLSCAALNQRLEA